MRLGGRRGRLRRRSDGIAPADGLGGVADRRGPGAPALDRCGPAARPRVRAVRPACPAAGIPIEIVSDGYGFFIQPALERARRRGAPIVTARTTFAGRRPSIEFPNGHPTLPRVRDVQARSGCWPIGPRAGGSCTSATARATDTPRATATWSSRSGPWSGSASRPAGHSIDGRRSTRSTSWLAETLDAWRARSVDARAVAGGRSAAAWVLLRPGGVGRGPGGSAAGVVAAGLSGRRAMSRSAFGTSPCSNRPASLQADRQRQSSAVVWNLLEVPNDRGRYRSDPSKPRSGPLSGHLEHRDVPPAGGSAQVPL